MADEDLTSDDEMAIGRRLLHIKTSSRAARYLEDAGGRAVTVSENWPLKVAEHIRWLELNRDVKFGRKLLVEGDSARWARAIATKSGLASQVVELLQEEVERVGQRTDFPGGSFTVAVEGNTLYASAKGLRTRWEAYFNERPPSHIRMKQALRRLARGEEGRPRVGGIQRRVFEIPLDLIRP